MGMAVRDLGPCELIFNSVSLGSTNGNTFKFSEEVLDVMDDRFGSTPVDQLVGGNSCSLETELTRSTLAQLENVLDGGAVATTKLTVSSNVGASKRATAKTLIIKPIVGGVTSTTESEWLTIFIASPSYDGEWKYGKDQRTTKVTFTGFPVETVDEGVTGTVAGNLWAIGFDHA